MWKSSFLKFNGVYSCDNLTKDAVLDDILEEGISFQPKDPSNEVGVIRGFLPREKFLLDLRPLWVRCHGNE